MGKVIKWNDFCGQNLRRRKGKFSLSEEDLHGETENFLTKPTVLKVYSRDSTRRNGGGLVIRSGQDSLLNEDDALLDAGDRSEGEVGIGGVSFSDNSNSSEEFNIILDSDVAVKKEIQEETAFEGARCLLGEGDQECGVEHVGKKAQVLTHLSHNVSSFGPSSDDVGSF